MAHAPIYTKQFKTWDTIPAVITLNDASILLQIPEDTLRRHLEAGTIPGNTYCVVCFSGKRCG